MRIFKKLILLNMKLKLKRYKRDSQWYHKQGAVQNWYDEQGIPNLEKDILKLQNELNE